MTAPDLAPFDQPHFDEPWQAQIFAMVVALTERGLFTRAEWAQMLGRKIAEGPQEAGNKVYFDAWLQALEALMIKKKIATSADLATVATAWRDAAEATPYGQPIVLGARR